MTDREKAIVMAYTGICMLTGDKLQIFHKYVEDIMGKPVWTHEMALDSIADEIRANSKDDFIALCADESRSENPNKWIPVSERLPEVRQNVLCQCQGNLYSVLWLNHEGDWECIYPRTTYMQSFVIAWMPLPSPYKAESEE